MSRARLLSGLCVAVAAVLLSATSAFAASAFKASDNPPPVLDPAPPPGAQVLTYKFGPMKIKPGQNLIDVDIQQQRPAVNGWIVGFRPGLVDASDGKARRSTRSTCITRSGSWTQADLRRRRGEDVLQRAAPATAGATRPSRPGDQPHDPRPHAATEEGLHHLHAVFIPDTAPEAASIKAIQTLWMDVQGVKPYPVFDALRGSGTGGRSRTPTRPRTPTRDGHDPQQLGRRPRRDARQTAGHLHPGGLYTDLYLTRNGETETCSARAPTTSNRRARSPGTSSMSATGPNWRVAIKKGDVLVDQRDL